MSTETTDYLIVFRGTTPGKDTSPEHRLQFLNGWMAWYEGLAETGKFRGGRTLGEIGVVVSGIDGELVTDGPYSEESGTIGGFFYLNVTGLEEATIIAKDCPGLGYGGSVEVRVIKDACPVRTPNLLRDLQRYGEMPRLIGPSNL